MRQRKGRWVTRVKEERPVEVEKPPDCEGCNVVHVDFGGSIPATTDQTPLTNSELAGIRSVFSQCPIAKRALEGAT